MKIAPVIAFLESIADPALQESYDNAGLLLGNANTECTGILVALDATEEVILEAISRKANLVVAHHPIIFGPLKKINGNNYVEQAVITAIKNDIAVYAIHTNLDNIADGVNGRIAQLLGLEALTVLAAKNSTLKKLVTYAPLTHAEAVRNAIFAAGAGYIGNYSECSFTVQGTGTFNGDEGTHPYTGTAGKRHTENEMRIETIFPFYLENRILQALKAAHPYEEVAYDLFSLTNTDQDIGSGLIGTLPEPMDEIAALTRLKTLFNIPMIRHSELSGRGIKKVAVCGGAGSFLINKALAAGADLFITADLKYHEFFDAGNRMVLADIGHYESEQYTINLLQEFLEEKFPNFAVLKTEVDTNPVHYF